MKKCECGKELASNAKTCPNCGRRFTHPFVKVLAFLLIGSVILVVVAAIIGGSGPVTNTSSSVNPPPAVTPSIPISPAEKKYIQASQKYLDSANADGTEMATIMAGAANGTSTLSDIHAAIRKNLNSEKQRYSSYLATRGTVPTKFKSIDTHINSIHQQSITAFSSYLSYWTTGDLHAITRGADQYKAAVLEMNSTISDATTIVKTME
jgi:hypothetical protein